MESVLREKLIEIWREMRARDWIIIYRENRAKILILILIKASVEYN